jgi:outer membrane lipoprotein
MKFAWARWFLLGIAGIYLSGCSSSIPALIRQAPEGDIRIDEVQQNPADFIGSEVRWGGTIMGVENLPAQTLIEVLGRDLTKNGKPDSEGRSRGRFKIALKGFIEPEEFPTDRLMTVYGKLKKVADGKVGSYTYHYPIVEPSVYHLWAKERAYRYYDSYDPFYYHWYPYWYRHPYPYYWY